MIERKKASAAAIKAHNKYNANNYKSFTVNAKFDEYEKIEKYCNNNNISKAQLLLKSAMYIIDNNIELQ